MAGVIFTVGDPAYWERLANGLRGKIDYPTKWPVVGRDIIDAGRSGRVFLDSGLNRSRLMTPDLADILRAWLREPDFYRTQRLPLPISPRIRRLIFDPPGKTRVRRFSGPAGSGKSYIIAGRAAALASRGVSSLVVGFNITLSWFLRDMAYRHLRNMVPDKHSFRVASKRMIFTHADLAHKAKPPPNGFGAVLIDEGTDLSADQIQDLCVPQRNRHPWLAHDAEKMLAYDVTQDLYDRSSGWAVKGGPVGPFNTNPTRLPDGYRLPETLLPVLRDYASRFLHRYPKDLPDTSVDQGQLAGPVKLRWVQLAGDVDGTDELSALVDEVKRMTDRLPSDCSIADVVVLMPEHRQGFSFITALRERLGINATHVFGEGKCVYNEGSESWKDCSRCAQSRVLKLAFRGGTGKLKASTYHSFKGWEARNLILFADNATTRSGCVGFYVGLTRFSQAENGGMLTVVSSCEDLADFGLRHFNEYVRVDATSFMLSNTPRSHV